MFKMISLVLQLQIETLHGIMTPVLYIYYILECCLTSFQQWDFQWYHFNNLHSFNRDLSYNSNAEYCIHNTHITYYYYIVHTDVTDAYFLHECSLLHRSNDSISSLG